MLRDQLWLTFDQGLVIEQALYGVLDSILTTADPADQRWLDVTSPSVLYPFPFPSSLTPSPLNSRRPSARQQLAAVNPKWTKQSQSPRLLRLRLRGKKAASREVSVQGKIAPGRGEGPRRRRGAAPGSCGGIIRWCIEIPRRILIYLASG